MNKHITVYLTKILFFTQRKTPQALLLLTCGVSTLYSNSQGSLYSLLHVVSLSIQCSIDS